MKKITLAITVSLVFFSACTLCKGDASSEESKENENKGPVINVVEEASDTPVEDLDIADIDPDGTPKRPDELGIIPIGESTDETMFIGKLAVGTSDLPEEITADIFDINKTVYMYIRLGRYDNDSDEYGVSELILVARDAPDSPYSLSVWPESYEVRFFLTAHDDLLSSGKVGEGTITDKDGCRYVTYNIECQIKPVSNIFIDIAYELPDYGKGEIRMVERSFEP